MDLLGISILISVVLVVLLGSGVWIAISLLACGWLGMQFAAGGIPAGAVLATKIWGNAASWELAALPLFIWMGEILFRTKLSEEMFRGLAPWLGRYILESRLTRRTPFDLPLLLFLLTAGVGVWSAYDRSAAWPKFWLIVCGLLLFYALANAEPIGEMRIWLLSLFGAGVAAYFLVSNDWDAYPAKIDVLTRLGHAVQAPLPPLPGHRLHPNVAGGIMAMLLPYAGWTVARTWQNLRRGVRPVPPRRWLALLLALTALAVTAFALLMTTSRGAWLGLAVAMVLAGLWAISGWLSRDHARRRAWLFPGLLAAALALILALGMLWPGGVIALVDAVPGPKTGLGRLDLLRSTLILARDYPIIGAGLGGFQMLHSTYVLLIHVGFTVHSHNLYLNVAIEQGLLALLALLWMAVLFGAAVWRCLLRPGARRGPNGLGVAALSLVIILTHGLVDDVLYGSRSVLLLFVPLAFAVPCLKDWIARLDRRALLVLPVGIVLLIALALNWRGPVLASISSNLGAVRQSQAELSTYAWPDWPIQDALRRATDLGHPIAYYERALVLDPGNATANRRLGQIELSLGEYEDALAHLEAAYASEPWSSTTRQLYGEALIVNGRVDEGQALWSTLSAAQGQVGIRLYWYDSIGDTQRAAWIQEAGGQK